jgi:uncharacterized protein with FMN-binding domain
MKKKLKWVGLIVLLLVVILGVAFAVFMKKSEKNFEALMAMPVPMVDLTTLSDGSYTGAYSVFPVDVEVTVEVSAQKIVDITIDKHINGQGKPAEVIIDSVISEQSLDVDMVSGATYSSKVILKAIEDALVK